MNGNGDILSEQEVRLIVSRTVKSTDFRIENYHVKPASETPEGFLGEHLKVRVTVTLPNGKSSEFSYFAKVLPRTVPQHLEYALSIRAFYKEIEMYKHLFADMKNAKTTLTPTKWCPDYYYSKGEELFVVEDLCTKGYTMLKGRILMEEDCMRACLRAIAAMHASSFILEEKFRTESHQPKRKSPLETNLFNKYNHLTYETEVADVKGHPGHEFVMVGVRSQSGLVSKLNNYTDEEKQKIRKKLPDALSRIFPLVKPSDRYRNVFIHGDLWANNLLFRKGENGKIQDALIIDFQLARYAPPAHDLMMFFYLVQDQEFREKKETEMIDYYYECLREELAANGISVVEVFPKEELIESCSFYRELGAVSAVLYFQLILAPSKVSGKFMASPELYHNVMFVDRSEMIAECFETDEIFRKRMTEAMNVLIQNYILK